jgi:hypothetical protein
MKTRTLKYISDQKYFIEVKNEDFSEEDNKLIQKFGEPEVNVGGLYGEESVEGEPASPTADWILPNKYVKIKKGFQPFISFFDKRSFADAQTRANYLAETIITRIQSAMSGLRSQQDSYTSESITNI